MGNKQPRKLRKKRHQKEKGRPLQTDALARTRRVNAKRRRAEEEAWRAMNGPVVSSHVRETGGAE